MEHYHQDPAGWTLQQYMDRKRDIGLLASFAKKTADDEVAEDALARKEEAEEKERRKRRLL